jgi:hypothetical protein
MAMNDITAALLGQITPELAIDREVLRAAVMRSITCGRTGRVLDVRTAVLITVTMPDGRVGTEVLDGAAYDAVADVLGDACRARGATLELIDGRVINPPRSTRTQPR